MKFACNVDAKISIFTDPCEDTPKYLEVEYTCNGKEEGHDSAVT